MLKRVRGVIASSLTRLSHLFLMSEIYPKSWNGVNSVPIYKTNNTTIVVNYTCDIHEDILVDE